MAWGRRGTVLASGGRGGGAPRTAATPGLDPGLPDFRKQADLGAQARSAPGSRAQTEFAAGVYPHLKGPLTAIPSKPAVTGEHGLLTWEIAAAHSPHIAAAGREHYFPA